MNDYGPNVTKLILVFMSRSAIPPGGGIADGMRFFTDQEHRRQVMGKAVVDAMTAIQLIKLAPDNPFGDNDEEIAGVILKEIEKRKANDGRSKEKEP